MTAQQTLPLEPRVLHSPPRTVVPRLDVRLDAVQLRDRPRERGHRPERTTSDTTTPITRQHRVTDRSTATRQLPQPQPNRADRRVSGPLGHHEGKPGPFGMALPLPVHPLPCLLRRRVRGQRADQRNVRILTEFDRQPNIVRAKCSQHQTTMRRRRRRPRRKKNAHRAQRGRSSPTPQHIFHDRLPCFCVCFLRGFGNCW